jgi:glycosyltransferase involved in cell wall biosynthesis
MKAQMSFPGISVVIPTNNRASLLESAMDSVARQTLAPHELIIVDDGSTDNTGVVVQSWMERAQHTGLTVRYFYQEQAGVPVARNAGVAAATGEWVAFLDSDDRWLPQKLQLQKEALERFEGVSEACVTNALYVNNPDLVTSAFEMAGTQCVEDIGVFPGILRNIAHGKHGLYLQTLLVRRSLVLDIGGFDPLLKLGDDSDLLFKIATRTTICFVNLPLVEIDRTPNRADALIELARKERFQLQTCQHLYEGWLALSPEVAPDIRKRVMWSLQEIHTGWSSWHLINRDYDKAFGSISLAAQYRVTGKVALKWALVAIVPGLARSLILKRRASARPQELV